MNPDLTVVAASRNDDHGGHLQERMQWFVDGLDHHARRTGASVELNLVEWNPPPDRPGLAEALRWPEHGSPLRSRVLRVPPAVHDELVDGASLPMLQMLAKNVGIRRASGRAVLATNIDILLSAPLFDRIVDRPEPGTVVRTDRYDVEFPFPPLPGVDEALIFCHCHPLRFARRDGVHYPGRGRVVPVYQSAADALRFGAGQLVRAGATAGHGRQVRRAVRSHGPTASAVVGRSRDRLAAAVGIALLPKLHENACGDFTLLPLADWERLRGYPEWVAYSWHLDSLLLHQARTAGMRFVELGPPAVAYHMEHAQGSGWTPEGHGQLFASSTVRGLPYLTDADLRRHKWVLARARRLGRPVVFNDDRWGLADGPVEEIAC